MVGEKEVEKSSFHLSINPNRLWSIFKDLINIQIHNTQIRPVLCAQAHSLMMPPQPQIYEVLTYTNKDESTLTNVTLINIETAF